MSDIIKFPIKDNFWVQLIVKPETGPLTQDTRHRVEAIWEQELACLGSDLFNGEIFTLTALAEHAMEGYFVEYKYYLAQIKDPSLKPFLQVHPVGVSGLVVSDDRFLIGKRSQAVLLDRGCFECVPSGGIDSNSVEGNRISIEKQILLELYEETGLEVTTVAKVKPLFVFLDKQRDLYEICVHIQLPADASRNYLVPTREYDELLWIDQRSINSFMKNSKPSFLALSKYLLLEAYPTLKAL